jgi:hypothetical protein
MQDSVLNLGEKIKLAARLAAIEHVRQMLEQQKQQQERQQQDEQQGKRRKGPGGAAAERFKDEPASQPLPHLANVARTTLSGLVMPTQPATDALPLGLRGAA